MKKLNYEKCNGNCFIDINLTGFHANDASCNRIKKIKFKLKSGRGRMT